MNLKPDASDHTLQAKLGVFATEFHEEVTPATALRGQALRAWIEDVEDRRVRLFRKMGYMRNCTPAERQAAYDRLMEMRGDRPLPEDL